VSFGYFKIKFEKSAAQLELEPDYVFQQVNDPKHRANIVKERLLRKHQIKTKADLKETLEEEWRKLLSTTLQIW